MENHPHTQSAQTFEKLKEDVIKEQNDIRVEQLRHDMLEQYMKRKEDELDKKKESELNKFKKDIAESQAKIENLKRSLVLSQQNMQKLQHEIESMHLGKH